MNNSMVLPVSTGYDTIIADRIPTKFVTKAKTTGVVKEVRHNDFIEILYKDGIKEKFSLKLWSSKEEAGSTYIHYMITDLKKNDRVKERSIITYDTSFFERDMFDTESLVMKTGCLIRIAYKEIEETFEDSIAISQRLTSLLSTKLTKFRSITTNVDNKIIDMVKLNDKVSYHDKLLTIIEVREDNEEGFKLSDETIELLENQKNKSPKAEKDGLVKMIKCFYNCEYSDMSPSIKKLVLAIEKETGVIGKVNNGYSINGNKLAQGEIEFKIYIEGNLGLGGGDKLVVGNQLKCTVSTVFDNNITSEDGNPIDGKFSTKSKDNRIVNSIDIIAGKTTCLLALQKAMIKTYFG